jgi:tetratricopeptide (TPR) repeat protein
MLLAESNTDNEGRVQFNFLPAVRILVIAQREGYVTAREPLGFRQSRADIFFSITLAKSATLKKGQERGEQVSAAVLALSPKARREHTRAMQEARAGNFQRAAEHLEKAVHLSPDSSLLWNDLGSNYLRLQKPDAAESSFRKALEIDPNYAAALFNLALLHNARREFEQAEALLLRFTDLENQRWQGFVELGNAHYGLAEFAKAENDFKRALSLDSPAPPETRVKLANVYVARGEYPKARRELEIYLNQAPGGVLAAQARAVVERMESNGVVASPASEAPGGLPESGSEVR